ncbi:MAG TPA: oligopeptide:H+ symporter, partial [Victivallales bacterium]|nr:oligopeptide:H+ symporter [Victivallales bacterium]
MSTTNVATEKQPKSFFMIFFLEFWERFGYYGMVALITLYFVQALGYTEALSFQTYGIFVALVYGYGAIGGYIGDKYLGTKRTIVLGALTLFVGYSVMVFSTPETVFYALGIIAAGNGLFKPNPSSLLSKCYTKNDVRMHSGFTMYYMAINLGALISMTATPFIAKYINWHVAFLVSSIGMLLAVINYLYFKKTVEDAGSEADRKPFSISRIGIVIVGTIIVSYINGILLVHLTLAQTLVWVVVAILFGIYFVFASKEKKQSRNRMIVAFVLILEAIAFFTLYQQMQTSVNFYTINNVTTTFFGYTIPPLVFQNINSLIIIIGSPILAAFYMNRARKGKDLRITTKFAVGMFLMGLAFLSLYVSPLFADKTGHVSSLWVFIFYIFEGPGELLISALGVAMVAELVPGKLVGFVMGLWFLTSAIGGVTGGLVASLTSPPAGITGAVNTLPIYAHVFMEIGVATLIFTALMFVIKPLLDKYIYKNGVSPAPESV